ncbi:MAG: flagellar biosynthetic protein FliO [Betaproteobacteria bacterium]
MDTPVASLLWFVLVLALIPAALWVLKRMSVVKGTQSAPSRVVGMLPLSGSQRLLTVEVGQGDHKIWLVLGVTASSIQLLHTLPAQEVGPASTDSSASFAQTLQRWRSGTGDKA